MSKLQPIDRRAFLRGTASLTALVWLAPLPRQAWAGGIDLPVSLLASWPGEAAAIMLSVTHAILPGATPQTTEARLDVLRRCDGWYQTEPTEIQQRLGLALRVLDYRPLLSTHFGRFSNLPLDARRQVLIGDFAQSRVTAFRTIFVSLKSLVLFNFYDHPAVWPDMGYDGPWVGRPTSQPAAAGGSQ